MDNDLSPQNKRWVLYENGLFVIHNNYLIGQKLQKETLKFFIDESCLQII